jgi:hypothetical protein
VEVEVLVLVVLAVSALLRAELADSRLPQLTALVVRESRVLLRSLSQVTLRTAEVREPVRLTLPLPAAMVADLYTAVLVVGRVAATPRPRQLS